MQIGEARQEDSSFCEQKEAKKLFVSAARLRAEGTAGAYAGERFFDSFLKRRVSLHQIHASVVS